MEINEFVRTDKEIGKVVYLYDDGEIEIENSKERILIYKCNITKHSKDIIDLIEKTDCVVIDNRICQVYDDINGELRYFDIEDRSMKYLKFATIQKVLTNQQFTQNAYVLEKER